MIDSVIETYPEDQVPEHLNVTKENILRERKKLKDDSDPVAQILEYEDVKELMESARDREGNSRVLEYVQQKHNVSH
jgi:eIF3 subunit 6 N terminal domain